MNCISSLNNFLNAKKVIKLKFNLMSLGFNGLNLQVPSRTLNRVTTVRLIQLFALCSLLCFYENSVTRSLLWYLPGPKSTFTTPFAETAQYTKLEFDKFVVVVWIGWRDREWVSWWHKKWVFLDLSYMGPRLRVYMRIARAYDDGC